MANYNKELEKYFPIADMIAKTFGETCEVVIHDLSTPKNSVVYAVNNTVTGRQIGQPFEHLIRQVLLSKRFENGYAANYRTLNKNGDPIKSSTALLQNSSGEVIGALCINVDFSEFQKLNTLMAQMMYVESDEPSEAEEDTSGHVFNIVSKIADNIIGDVDVTNLERQARMDIISFMDNKGVFLVKGAIDYVAERLKISKVTIYSYLDEIKKENT